MEEQTITDTPTDQNSGGINGIAVDSAGRAIPEPETVEAPAESQPTEQVQTNEPETVHKDEPQGELDELSKWAANKGVEITNDSERKFAEMARNSEKAMHTKATEASSLQKSVQSTATTDEFGDPLTALQQEVQQLKLDQSVRNFYQDHPDARDMDDELSKLVEERPHLVGDLEALYALAQMKNSSARNDTLKNEGGREALERLASRQSAVAPQANATNGQSTGSQITLQNVDSLIARNGHEWYMQNRDEINKVIEGR